MIRLYHWIKKRGFIQLITKEKEVRKYLAELDQLTEQLIFYNIISLPARTKFKYKIKRNIKNAYDRRNKTVPEKMHKIRISDVEIKRKGPHKNSKIDLCQLKLGVFR